MNGLPKRCSPGGIELREGCSDDRSEPGARYGPFAYRYDGLDTIAGGILLTTLLAAVGPMNLVLLVQ